jgi:8-oxo-dGTP pyrophosphatase MutT (NUDIX family)
MNDTRIWKGRFTELIQRNYIDKNGDEQKWELVKRNTPSWISSAAATLIEDIENKLYILVEQYRVPIDWSELSLVAGITDEAILTSETIKKEAREEAGRIVTASKFLETISSSSGLTDEETDIYHSICGPEFVWQSLEPQEDIKIHEIPINEIDSFLFYAVEDLWLRVSSKIDTALRHIRAWKWINP